MYSPTFHEDSRVMSSGDDVEHLEDGKVSEEEDIQAKAEARNWKNAWLKLAGLREGDVSLASHVRGRMVY
jgi:hypothetical protein